MNSGSAKPLVPRSGRYLGSIGTVEGRSRCMYCLPHLYMSRPGRKAYMDLLLPKNRSFSRCPVGGSSVEFGRAVPKDFYYQKGIITSSLGLPSSIPD